MKKSDIYRWIFYLTGLLVLAVGIILNTKAGLGVSPIISVAYCVSELLGRNFGNMTLLLYSSFIVIELGLHTIMNSRRPAAEREKLWELLLKDVLQFPVSLIFTRFMNLFSAMIPACGDVDPGSFYGSLAGKILILLAGIVLTGIGVAMSVSMHLIPNPGDGIVKAISDFIGKSVGFTKNCFDLSCVLIAVTVGLLASGHLIGIGVGTVMAVIGVGRSVALFNYLFLKKMEKMAGII